MGITAGFQWFGRQVEKAVLGDVDAKLIAAGAQWQGLSASLAPRKTGFLISQERYTVQNHTLTLILGADYDIFQELGTRTVPAHPHALPALNAINRVFGGTIDLEFNAPLITAPVLAHRGTMIVPSGIQPRPLTQAQHRRVRANAAVAKGLYRGNVKRAGFKVKRSF